MHVNHFLELTTQLSLPLLYCDSCVPVLRTDTWLRLWRHGEVVHRLAPDTHTQSWPHRISDAMWDELRIQWVLNAAECNVVSCAEVCDQAEMSVIESMHGVQHVDVCCVGLMTVPAAGALGKLEVVSTDTDIASQVKGHDPSTNGCTKHKN